MTENNPIITAYNNLKTLIRQITYSKEDIDERIGDIDSLITSTYSNVYPSEVVDSVTDNDMRPVSSNAVYDALNTDMFVIVNSLESVSNPTDKIYLVLESGETDKYTMHIYRNGAWKSIGGGGVS